MNPAVLLIDPSPILRQLVLKELLSYPADEREVMELELLKATDPAVTALFTSQLKDGSWKSLYGTGTAKKGRIYTTSIILKRLGFFGYTTQTPAVKKAVNFLFSEQQPDGSWPLVNYKNEDESKEGYTMIPLQTAIPLHALLNCGVISDPRIDAAFHWLMERKLPDGTWPTGRAGDVYGGVGGYRRMPFSRWGCRTNSTEVLCCLSLHPVWRKSTEAARLLDMLLGRESRERFTLGFETARLSGIEPTTGYLTYHARFDPGLILDFCWRLGADAADERISALLAFVRAAQGEYGLWEYLPNPLASRWVSFSLLRALCGIENKTEWISMVPRISFQAYPKKEKRF